MTDDAGYHRTFKTLPDRYVVYYEARTRVFESAGNPGLNLRNGYRRGVENLFDPTRTVRQRDQSDSRGRPSHRAPAADPLPGNC